MADPSTILASLDLFIERFKSRGELESGHRVATEKQALVTAKPAENKDIGHCGHSGHSDQDRSADDPHHVPDRDSALESDVVIAPKVSLCGGYNGHSGQSQESCGFDGGHSGNGIGHSGHTRSDQKSWIELNAANDRADKHGGLFADDPWSEAEYWSHLYQERAAIREYDGGYPCAEADQLAWGEIEWRWHMAHCGPAIRGVCAGCRQPIDSEAVITLIDGNCVHDRRDHACLIRFGEHWRSAARRALISLGLQPPTGAS